MISMLWGMIFQNMAIQKIEEYNLRFFDIFSPGYDDYLKWSIAD